MRKKLWIGFFREEMVGKINIVLRDNSKVSFYDVKLTDN